MNIGEASDVQAVLALLNENVDPISLSEATRHSAFRLAVRSSQTLSAGLTPATLWAEYQPLEGMRP